MSRPPPTPVYTLRGAGGPLNTLHFHCSQGSTPLLFSGSGKGAIHMYNLNTRRPERVIEGHSGNSVIWLNTIQSEQKLISQGRDMQICLWDLAEGRYDVVDSIWTGSVGFCQSSMLETSAGKWMLAFPGEQTEEVRSYNTLPSKTLVSTLVPDSKLGMVMCIKLWQSDLGTGPLLLAGYEDGSVLLWDVTQRSKLSQAKAHPEPVMCLTFDPTHLKGISGSSDSKLSSWIVDNSSLVVSQLQDSVTLVNPGVSQMCLRDDGKLLASAGWDHRVRLFGWKRLKPLAVLQYHTDMVLSVAFSNHQDPRQRLLAAGSKDHRISLWSVYSEGSQAQ
uniref:Uncharacterized protein n=1 Tax=Periophthalmus magnuspinnatus TaxID=409849 RepID=A0A3B4AIP7_9GOBI